MYTHTSWGTGLGAVDFSLHTYGMQGTDACLEARPERTGSSMLFPYPPTATFRRFYQYKEALS